jgi:hypothetical protein
MIEAVRYREGMKGDSRYDYIAVDVTAVPSVAQLYRLAAELELPRPVWPLEVVNEALRRAGL